MKSITDSAAILRDVLDQWKAGVDGHEPQRIASLFTEDAILTCTINQQIVPCSPSETVVPGVS